MWARDMHVPNCEKEGRSFSGFGNTKGCFLLCYCFLLVFIRIFSCVHCDRFESCVCELYGLF